MKFNLNKCIVKGIDDEVVTITLCEGNLYQMDLKKVHEVDAANLA